ncbi:MAG: SulP family inorganic anion transporter [Burkholderiales bacterium]|nr:SulP family inorganic anion transporter [Burkholderiales bacterium]
MAVDTRIASWLVAYRPEWLRADLLAGVSVAAVALPIAIAYSQLAGVPPVYGLYASLLPLVAYAFLGSSRQLIVAPDAATCTIVAAIVAPLAAHDAARYVSLTAALAMITGVFCVAAGIARLGFLTNFLARPILTGYLNGIALCIIAGQLGALFGFSLEPAGFFHLMWQFLSRLEETHLPTLAVGATTSVVLVWLGRVVPKAPGPLVAMIVGTACSAVLGFQGLGVKLLGEIPAGLPAFAVPAIAWSDWKPLALGAVGLALISYNSAMVTARGFAAKNRYDIDPNREFIALGVANIGAGILQGYAVSGADSRTAVNDAIGGKSQVTGLVAAAVLALTLLYLTEPLQWLPLAVLSAVLVKAAMGLFDLPALATLRRVSPPEFRLCIISLLGVISVGVLPGVVVAIGAAIVQLLIRASRPHDAVLGRVAETKSYHDRATHPQAECFPGLVIYRFDAALVFFNADHFKARLRSVVRDKALGAVRCVVIDAETIPYLDTTGAACLEQVRTELEATGITLAVAAAKNDVRNMLSRTGIAERIGHERMFHTLEAAVQALYNRNTNASE